MVFIKDVYPFKFGQKNFLFGDLLTNFLHVLQTNCKFGAHYRCTGDEDPILVVRPFSEIDLPIATNKLASVFQVLRISNKAHHLLF